MDKIEQIKAEIERRIKKYNKNAIFEQGYREGLTQLLSFINALPEEKPSEDLEKAALEFAEREYMDNYEKVALYKGFWWGAQWQKEQMMKEIEDNGKCVIIDDFVNIPSEMSELGFNHIFPDNEAEIIKKLGLKDGDKVKIIIVKED